MPANDRSDWQFEKSKQKTTATKRGHCCSHSAFGKVRFLGHMYREFTVFVSETPAFI